MVRAAGFGAGARWVNAPPVLRLEAENEFGSEITDDAWREICQAFRRHGERLDHLKGTRDN